MSRKAQLRRDSVLEKKLDSRKKCILGSKSYTSARPWKKTLVCWLQQGVYPLSCPMQNHFPNSRRASDVSEETQVLTFSTELIARGDKKVVLNVGNFLDGLEEFEKRSLREQKMEMGVPCKDLLTMTFFWELHYPLLNP